MAAVTSYENALYTTCVSGRQIFIINCSFRANSPIGIEAPQRLEKGFVEKFTGGNQVFHCVFS